MKLELGRDTLYILNSLHYLFDRISEMNHCQLTSLIYLVRENNEITSQLLGVVFLREIISIFHALNIAFMSTCFKLKRTF